MAVDTPLELRNQVIYEAYPRNHTKEGTFKALEEDLDRIKELGTDILWLMPVHPVGKKNKKGELGCPYAVRDYRKINSEYGTLSDFKDLIKSAHQRDMKVMIDIVYNHTSPDAKLLTEHPEWFYKDKDGRAGNKIGDWYDVIDLDYNDQKLWEYQIETLKYWVKQGVDGFRCDVAPMVPLKFWKQAREEVAKLKKDVIWLAESVEPSFLKALRRAGFTGLSDSELYQAFDVTYSYDTFEYFKAYMSGRCTLDKYIIKLKEQEYIYPDNFVKMRFLENHDQLRARKWLPEDDKLRMWTAFYYFQQGLTLIYGGQETNDSNTPSLFNKDPIDWEQLNKEYVNLLKKLAEIKSDPIFAEGYYQIKDVDKRGVVLASYQNKDRELIGVFNLEMKKGPLKVDCPDGKYKDLITNERITVKDKRIELSLNPVIFETTLQEESEKINLEEL